jgi:hypothetical protein
MDNATQADGGRWFAARIRPHADKAVTLITITAVTDPAIYSERNIFREGDSKRWASQPIVLTGCPNQRGSPIKTSSRKAAIIGYSKFIIILSVDASEVVYDEISPDESRKVSENYIFTVSEKCPDGHRLHLRLLTCDTDFGKSNKDFFVQVHNIGPLEFGSAVVDDDMPGPSDGNGDKVLDPGETIEFRVDVRNSGQPDISNAVVRLVSEAPYIRFGSV